MSESERTSTRCPGDQNSSKAISVTPSLSREAKIRKGIQMQLRLLSHAYNCPSKQENQCSDPNCQTFKNVFKHMATCSDVDSCNFPHCTSSNLVLWHWKRCTDANCEVCIPFHQEKDIQQKDTPLGLQPNAGNSSASNDPVTQPSQADANTHAMSESERSNTQRPGDQNSSKAISVIPLSREDKIRLRIQMQLRLLLHAYNCPSKQENQCSDPDCQTFKNVFKHMATCGDADSCNFEFCTSSNLILWHWKRCTNANCEVCIPLKQTAKQNQENMQQKDTPLGLQPNAGNSSANNDPVTQPSQADANTHGAIPNEPRSSKTWHRLMTEKIREHLVERIVQVIFPTFDISAIQDEGMFPLVECARKLENCVYETADDIDKYCQILAEKVYQIHKEVAMKRQKLKDSRKQSVEPGLGPAHSSDSSVTQPNVLPSWKPLSPRLKRGPGHVSSSSFMTVPPNTTEEDFEVFSPGSQLSNTNVNSESKFNLSQVPLSPPPCANLIQQQFSHAHADNMSTPAITTASGSVDSSTFPTYSKLTLSSSEPQLTNVNANIQSKSNEPEVCPSPLPVSLQQQFPQAHVDNMSTPAVTTASGIVDSSTLPTYSATTGSKLPLSSSSKSQLTNVNVNIQSLSNEPEVCPSPPHVSLQQQQLPQAHLNNMNPPATTTALVNLSSVPTYSAAFDSKHELSNFINANSQSQSNLVQDLPSPLFSARLQRQQLPQADLGNTNTFATTPSAALPSTVRGISVSQSSSSPQQNHSQMPDSSETRKITSELLKEDKEESSKTVEGSVLSEDEEKLLIIL